MKNLLATVRPNLGDKSYPIYIGEQLLEDIDLFAPYLQNRRCAIITDTNVAPLYLDKLRAGINKDNIIEIILPPNEEQKRLSTLEEICTVLLNKRMTRADMIFALGGGVIGDLGGFAAACYQRGIAFIQIPTTLLAQVDSSVGGKTGVNHPLGKNMIGAFHQPQAVMIDLSTLQTLPDRQTSAGIAEIIKYGLIFDADFFTWLESNIQALKNLEMETLSHAVRRSCEIKAQVVTQDELETRDHRILLNLGHTFGHAIETAMNYSGWLHGEAVGCGMVLAAKLSSHLGFITNAELDRITQLIGRAGLPVEIPKDLNPESLVQVNAKRQKEYGRQAALSLTKTDRQCLY